MAVFPRKLRTVTRDSLTLQHIVSPPVRALFAPPASSPLIDANQRSAAKQGDLSRNAASPDGLATDRGRSQRSFVPHQASPSTAGLAIKHAKRPRQAGTIPDRKRTEDRKRAEAAARVSGRTALAGAGADAPGRLMLEAGIVGGNTAACVAGGRSSTTTARSPKPSGRALRSDGATARFIVHFGVSRAILHRALPDGGYISLWHDESGAR